MRIGIDASRAFGKQRTGIEEYSFQIISQLMNRLDNYQVVLYVKADDWESFKNKVNFKLPINWQVKKIFFNYFWTQVGLAWEMLVDPVDLLFVPAHTVPWIHPIKTLVTIHGLEYEHCPESYSFFSRLTHRFFVKKSVLWSSRVIAVSQKTKDDLISFYDICGKKVEVIHNGVSFFGKNKEQKNRGLKSVLKVKLGERYLLFIGRLEKRKNIEGILQAFEILKEKYNYEGKLVLAGKPGYGYSQILEKLENIKSRYNVVELGYVSDQEKWELLKNAELFLFPSFCEGFGFPILEAQSVGTPVITSRLNPMSEVAGNSQILVDPIKPYEIANLADRLIRDSVFRLRVIEKGLENVKKFSWEKCVDHLVRLI